MNIAVLRRPIEFVRARRPLHGLEVRDGVGLLPGFPERLRAAAGLSAHLAAPRTPPDVERYAARLDARGASLGAPRAPANTKMIDGAASKTSALPGSQSITPKISQSRVGDG